jgi:CcmD family protein
MKKLIAILALTFSFLGSFAQQQDPEMADVMRSNGKIYVVVTAIMIVLVGLLVYLFLLDRRITRLEKKIEDNR